MEERVKAYGAYNEFYARVRSKFKQEFSTMTECIGEVY